uniref:Uncharacterized protein n=1 Tax=Ditylenchus dipsaci TaxID=166011 RepID=A0A915DHW5_9BILA
MASNYSNEVTYQLSGVALEEENDEDMTPHSRMPDRPSGAYGEQHCQAEGQETDQMHRSSNGTVQNKLRDKLIPEGAFKENRENLVGVLHEHENRRKQKDKDDLMDEKELAYAEDLQKARTSIFNDSFLK